MANTTYKYRTQHLRGTEQEWKDAESKGLKPLEGEIVIEIDDNGDRPYHKLKIGDGTSKYSELAYLMAGEEIVTQVLPRVVTVTLYPNAWKEDGNGKYYQDIQFEGIEITPKSQLDLRPTLEQIDEFKQLHLIFTTENHNTSEKNDNKLRVCVSGGFPQGEYDIQGSITETNIENENEVVVGIPIIASSSIEENKCGDNATWRVDEEGTLHIEGSGAMYNFAHSPDPSAPPWKQVQNVPNIPIVTKIKIHDGITYIGIRAFDTMENITEVSLGCGVHSMGYECFDNCVSLSSVSLNEGLMEIGSNSFRNTKLASITIPSSVKRFGNNIFDNCNELTDIQYLGSPSDWGYIIKSINNFSGIKISYSRSDNEIKDNKVQVIDRNNQESEDKYPSVKAVYDAMSNLEISGSVTGIPTKTSDLYNDGPDSTVDNPYATINEVADYVASKLGSKIIVIPVGTTPDEDLPDGTVIFTYVE